MPANNGAGSRTVFVLRFPKLAELMDGAEDDVLADAAFPVEHWQ